MSATDTPELFSASQTLCNWGMRVWMAEKFGYVEKYKRGGKHYYRVTFKYTNRDGERVRRFLYSVPTLGGRRIPFEGPEAAQAGLEMVRGDVRGGKTPEQALAPYLRLKTPETTVFAKYAEYIEDKEQDYRDGEITSNRLRELSQYPGRDYFREIGELSIYELDEKVLKNWLRWLRREFKLKPKTIQHIVNDFGTFMRWLKGNRDTDRVPDIPEVKLGQRKNPPVPTEEALVAYLDAIPEEIRGLWLARAYNGLRPSEARALDVADYDFDRNVFTLRHSKTGELLTMQADYELADWVQKWVKPRDALRSVALFRNPAASNGAAKRWTATPERRVHLRACKVIGSYFRPNHCGRHAFGTHAVKRTRDIEGVAKAMRHATTQTTRGYIDRDQLGIAHVLRPRVPRVGPQRARKPKRGL